jgi:TolA-binding protein
MSIKIKLAAYAVLIILIAWFGWGFYSSYTTVAKQAAAAATNDTAALPDTNQPPADTNQTAASPGGTNAAPTNQQATASATPKPAPPAHAAQGSMIAYLAALVGAFVGLGLLIAYDVTHYVGGAAVDALLDDRGEGARDPEYERAEQAWANGKHLEAIEIMRDFLKKNPREQYAALRIAEIYEKDLNNPLAAALEYEEVLKKKLPAERWGWAAIHLCNLYSKLGQQDKTLALLQRIVDTYPQTAAAKKARSKLGLPEPEFEKAPVSDNVESADAPAAPKSAAGEESESSKSNLPPGFRPK